jgi:hypothetical protein
MRRFPRSPPARELETWLGFMGDFIDLFPAGNSHEIGFTAAWMEALAF